MKKIIENCGERKLISIFSLFFLVISALLKSKQVLFWGDLLFGLGTGLLATFISLSIEADIKEREKQQQYVCLINDFKNSYNEFLKRYVSTRVYYELR